MDEKTFERVEKKYLLTKNEADRLAGTIRLYMHEDNYFKSKVFNLYYDTPNYDLIIKSIDNPMFKEKLRARSYGGYNKVFLEIKTKLRGKEFNVGHKRRVLMTKSDYRKFTNHKKTAESIVLKTSADKHDLQIAREVDHLMQHFNLEPKILVYYDRESYVGAKSLRITFDRNLHYRDQDLKFVRRKKDPAFFNSEKCIIMEVKAHGVLPLWLSRALSESKIFPARFSKIGKVYEALRKEQNV